MNDHLLSRFSKNNTSLTPGEIIHPPERIERQEEGEGGDSNDVEQHPSNHVPLAPHDEDESLQAIDSSNHN